MATSEKKLAIQPLADRVVVKPMKKEEVSASGILIPDSAKREAPSKGTVVAAGLGRYEDGDLIPMTVKVGDQVLFSKYGYDEVKINDEEYYILAESGVLAILK
jgi:chaperonin GroES